MARLFCACAVIASLAACDACHHPGAAPPSSADCASACAKLRALRCPEGDPMSGESCEQLCEEVGPMLDVACVSGASSVDDLHACRVRCSR